MLYFVYLCLCLRLGLLMIWSIFHYHFHFHCNKSYNLIKTSPLVYLDIFNESSASCCCLAFAYFFVQSQPGVAYKSAAYKKNIPIELISLALLQGYTFHCRLLHVLTISPSQERFFFVSLLYFFISPRKYLIRQCYIIACITSSYVITLCTRSTFGRTCS